MWSFNRLLRERKTQALLFDLDGTLLDSSFQMSWMVAAKANLYHALTQLSAANLNRVLSLSEKLRLVQTSHRHDAIPGAVPFVRRASQRYDLGIVTLRDRAFTRQFLAHYGIESAFKALITRKDAYPPKPHPNPVRCAAFQLGHPTEQCIMIGDTAMDIQAGKRAGALTVGVLSGWDSRMEMMQVQPDMIVESVDCLSTWFETQDTPAGSYVHN